MLIANDNELILKRTGFIKTILMLMVMLGHSMAFYSGSWIKEIPVVQDSPYIGLLYGWINSIHVYSFTSLSGYLFAFKMSQGGYPDFRRFIKNKARRLLVPYCFVALLWVIPISVALFKWDYRVVFERFILGMNPNQLWFLLMLFGVFIIGWIFWRVFSWRNTLFCYGLCLFLFLIGKAGSFYLNNYYCIWSACQYSVFFVIGIRLYFSETENTKYILEGSIFKKVFRTQMIPIWIIVDLCLYIIHSLIQNRPGGMWKLIDIGVMLCLHVVGAIGAILILFSIAIIVDRSYGIDSRLSRYAMPMYLFHQQIIYFSIIWLNGKINPFIHVMINFIFAFVCSYMISVFLMRWRFTRMLIGEK